MKTNWKTGHPVQRRMSLGVPQLRPHQVDTAALVEGVRHLGPSLASAVRKDAPMPVHLRPDIDGRPLAEQIGAIWGAYLVYGYRKPSERTERAKRLRYQAILRIYRDLADAGYHLQRADAIKERHVKALVECWRERGKAAATVRSQWSILRVWMQALGRPGMVGPIEAYWPDLPAREKAGEKASERAGGEAAGENLRAKRLGKSQMTALMRADDPTSWLVERLHLELGFTVEEALLFSAGDARDILGDKSAAVRNRELGQRVRAGRQEAVLLVQQIEAFMAERGRRRLMWQDMPIEKALKKHQNRVAYIRRTVADDGPGEAPGTASLDASAQEEGGHGEQ